MYSRPFPFVSRACFRLPGSDCLFGAIASSRRLAAAISASWSTPPFVIAYVIICRMSLYPGVASDSGIAGGDGRETAPERAPVGGAGVGLGVSLVGSLAAGVGTVRALEEGGLTARKETKGKVHARAAAPI